MRLVVALPHELHVDTEVGAVGAEGLHGSFTMLPHHLDHVVLLVPGVLTYRTTDGDERFVAVDGGVLTKVGDQVRVATPAAAAGGRLEELERLVDDVYRRLDEREANARAALTRIESQVVRDLFEFEERS